MPVSTPMSGYTFSSDTMYAEDDYIMLSSLQHYVFCPRQCGLIHVAGAWNENHLTARGRVLHERVDSGDDETRGPVSTVRSLAIYSARFGLSGKADVVEFHDEDTKQAVYPVEYKAGKPKLDECDTVQLCAQALCLEEMLGINIAEAALFYGKTRHRLRVVLDIELRHKTEITIDAVHAMVKAKIIPGAVYSKKCRSCSLEDTCMPRIRARKIQQYIAGLYHIDEATP